MGIAVECVQFWIHAAPPLVVKNVSLLKPLVSPLEFVSELNGTVKVVLPQPMTGNCIFEFVFDSKVNHNLEGCYISYNNRSESMICTHFEPDYARQAFPCFDEPIFKAKFQLKIKVTAQTIVVSNMPVAEISETANSKTFLFQETPLMSCYLLHWTIFACSYIETTTTTGTLLRLYSNPVQQSYELLELARDSLEFYIEYFNTQYPLPKLDLISVFKLKVRAMENWGCITFDERILSSP